MASPPELSLDCKPHSYSMLLKSVGEQSDQTQKLEEFLSHLEEERLKIDAFKRELPLCMQLLTNAMETSRQQLQSYRLNQAPKPILEEFIPLKDCSSEESDKEGILSDKSNWMTSAQLWSTQASNQATKQQSSRGTDHFGFDRNGRAFHPFPKERRTSCPSDQSLSALPNLALSCEDKDVNDKRINQESDLRRENSCRVIGNGTSVILEQGKGRNCQADSQANNNINTTTSQTQRKARRCWSPELHRRFVNALQMLGGSQVATPKQIRELMKVDGLTNDEVKSHLQKYRLHTRRPSPSPQAAASAAPQLVVLGGIWVPPEYTTAAAAAAHGGAPTTLYGGPPTAHAPAHYCAATPVSQDYHHPQLHNHDAALHGQLPVYKKPSHTQSLPESEDRGTGGDRSESIEDGKSESSSWKADSNGSIGAKRRR